MPPSRLPPNEQILPDNAINSAHLQPVNELGKEVGRKQKIAAFFSPPQGDLGEPFTAGRCGAIGAGGALEKTTKSRWFAAGWGDLAVPEIDAFGKSVGEHDAALGDFWKNIVQDVERGFL